MRPILSLLAGIVTGGWVSLVGGVVSLLGKITELHGRTQLLNLGEDRALAKLAKKSGRKQADAKRDGDSVDGMSDDDVDRMLGEDYRKD
jgi:hypothetical protein